MCNFLVESCEWTKQWCLWEVWFWFWNQGIGQLCSLSSTVFQLVFWHATSVRDSLTTRAHNTRSSSFAQRTTVKTAERSALAWTTLKHERETDDERTCGGERADSASSSLASCSAIQRARIQQKARSVSIDSGELVCFATRSCSQLCVIQKVWCAECE